MSVKRGLEGSECDNQESDEHRHKRQRTTKKQTSVCQKCGTFLAFWQTDLCSDCKHKQTNSDEHFGDNNNDDQHFDANFSDNGISTQCKVCALVFKNFLIQRCRNTFPHSYVDASLGIVFF